MNVVFFVRPIMAPMEFQPPPPPAVYYPVNNIIYRFPMPVKYSPPPVAVL